HGMGRGRNRRGRQGGGRLTGPHPHRGRPGEVVVHPGPEPRPGAGSPAVLERRQVQRGVTMTQWFDVDRAGLGRQAEEHGKGRLIGELVQNALDEEGVTQIAVTLALVPGRPLADLTVEDDAPEGFRDLTHAYTLFAESYKRGNPEQRGQFNFGEKLVLAVCESASISTTKGTVVFDPAEGRIERPRQKRERGSVFQGRIRLTREEYPQVCDYLRFLLLPDNVTVTFNGDRLLPRKPLRTFETSLESLVADEQ